MDLEQHNIGNAEVFLLAGEQSAPDASALAILSRFASSQLVDLPAVAPAPADSTAAVLVSKKALAKPPMRGASASKKAAQRRYSPWTMPRQVAFYSTVRTAPVIARRLTRATVVLLAGDLPATLRRLDNAEIDLQTASDTLNSLLVARGEPDYKFTPENLANIRNGKSLDWLTGRRSVVRDRIQKRVPTPRTFEKYSLEFKKAAVAKLRESGLGSRAFISRNPEFEEVGRSRLERWVRDPEYN